jgi:zinc transporter 2
MEQNPQSEEIDITSSYEQFNELKSHFLSDDEKVWFDKQKILDISNNVKRKLLFIIMICLFFIIVEAIGAYISKSIAIFSDVTHLLSDLLGFFVSLFAVYLGNKKASKTHSYGYVRAEIIGALFSVIFIWIMTIFIFIEAIDRLKRIINKETIEIDPLVMIITSFVGLGVNIIMACFLHGTGTGHKCSHGHGHGHDHDHSHGHNHHHGHSHSDDTHHHGHSHGKKHKHDKNEHKHKHDKKEHKKNHKHEDHHHDHEDHDHDNHDHDDHDHDHKDHEDHDHDQHKKKTSSIIKKDFKEDLDTEKSKINGTKCDEEYDEENHLNENLLIKKKLDDKRKNLNLSIKDAKENHNIKAAFIHILGDMIQSLGVIMASTVIYFKNDWVIIDPLISVVFSIIALSFSIPVTIQIIRLLLDTTPKELDMEKFQKDLSNIKYVREIHDLHVWEMTFGKPNLTAHIICTNYPEYVLKKATIICRKVGIYHSTIQVETSKTFFSINCEHNLHS